MKSYVNLRNSTSKILVIGDVMLDQYYSGYVTRISPESPVPVFSYKDNYYRLGGAANVAANLVSICGQVFLMSVIGNDMYGSIFKDILKESNIDYRFIVSDEERTTTVKTRLLAQNNQQMIRIDRENNEEININLKTILLEKLESNIKEFDIVLVSDYLKGLLTQDLLQDIIQICNENKKKVLIDIKGSNLDKYKGAYLLKPNNKELEDILNCKISNDNELVEAAKKLKMLSKTNAILVTRGEKGMVLIDGDDNINHIPTMAREVFDVTGAGDTVLSYLGASIANDMSLYDSAVIANAAAGIKVGKVGTSIVKLGEVEAYFNNSSDSIKKLVTLEEYLNIKKEHLNKTVVFTNGCFDILHVGHVRYLKQAAELGDVLIVGVNSDRSIKNLKGEKRPIVCEKDRIEMLANLNFIDYLVVFDEDTPYELIKIIEPDLLVKGGDYSIEDVVGKDIVEGKGGKVILIPLVEGISTSNIVETILSTYE
ncbi:D-glycero-beta-D-manno-heptose-7-phosphate kinase [Tissierella pigra]|uniref:Bifunctional protein HldE n=1 Tax=Tissierella pigra TaxID=2607614 RepID=A0A6N7XR60_9FIRM|nr:D-glycero-beta-D-manno-heptose-7-phosphate kinase [Tissierella pigra]MSU00237.1 D-glycero-beta-D-manno-heptose-7-phosphate kinase [Tissierella pigra]